MEINKEVFYVYLKSKLGLEISDSTTFFEQSGIDGLDAELLMLSIAKNYQVDLNEYNPKDYHQDEIEITNIFLQLWRAIRGKSPKHSSFTALHLYHVVQVGRWFNP